jgi:hypothetical protein
VESYSVLTWMGRPAGRGRGVDRRGEGDDEEGQRVYESAAEIERATMGYEVTTR